MYLHHPQHRIIKEIIAADAIGEIRSLSAAFAFQLTMKDNFRSKPDHGGGAFYDQASYPLSAALFFLEGTSYKFRGKSFFRGGLNIGMQAHALTDRNENLAFSIGFEQQYECWYELAGEKGKLRVDRAFTTPVDHANCIRIISGNTVKTIMAPAADHFMLMIEAVCDTLLEKRSYHPLYREAQRLALLTEQAQTGCQRVQVIGGLLCP
jgi:NDP-hexose-3-ketoreductase